MVCVCCLEGGQYYVYGYIYFMNIARQGVSSLAHATETVSPKKLLIGACNKSSLDYHVILLKEIYIKLIRPTWVSSAGLEDFATIETLIICAECYNFAQILVNMR